MASKHKHISRGAAIAVAAVALGAAALPSASAAVGSSYFGVKSVNTENSSITGYAGMGAPKTDSGGGSTTDPGTGEGSTPVVPATCNLDLTAPLSFRAQYYPDGNYYMVPLDGGGYSHWVDKILDSGGTIKMGAPTVTISDLDIATKNVEGNYDDESRSDVKLPELKLDAIQGQAIKANTFTPNQFHSWDSQDARDSSSYGAIQSPHSTNGQVQDKVYPLVQSKEFFNRLGYEFPERGYTVTGDPVLITANSVQLSYQLTAEWPADSAYSKCSASATAVSNSIYTGPE